jgi:hypothetical protein
MLVCLWSTIAKSNGRYCGDKDNVSAKATWAPRAGCLNQPSKCTAARVRHAPAVIECATVSQRINKKESIESERNVYCYFLQALEEESNSILAGMLLFR